MSKVRLGIIGCGNMAQWAHLPCFRMLNNATLAALYDPRQTVAQQVCNTWNIETQAESLPALLESDIDAVCVLTPVQCHKSQIIAALKAGKHVFTEKPLAMSAASAKEIKDAAEAAGKFVMVGYMKQHEFNIGEALDMAAKHEFGNIRYVRTHSFIGSYWHACVNQLSNIITSDEPLPEIDGNSLDYGPEFIESERDSRFYSFEHPYYGLLDTGCHSINLLRFLTKTDYSLASVYNKAGTKVMNFDFGDFMGTAEFSVNFNMHKWDEVTELFYEKGSITIRTPQPTFMQAGAKVEVYFEDGNLHQNLVLENNHEWAFRRQAQSFVDTIRKGAGTMAHINESINDIDMIETIYKQEGNK